MTALRRAALRTGLALALGLSSVAAVALATAPPAAAATTFTFTSPDKDVVTTTSSPTIAGHVDSDSFICSVDFLVHPTGSQPAGDQKSSIDLTSSGTTQPPNNYAFTWAPLLAANGPYTVTVTAHVFSSPFCQTRLDPGQPQTGTHSFSLAVPAAKPTGLVAAPTADRHVDLTWKANSEPDLTGYAVFRTVKDKTCPVPVDSDRIATVPPAQKPAFTDTFGSADAGGEFCYAVAAARPGADAKPSTAQVLSPFSDAATTTVAAPAASSGSGGTGAATGASGGSSAGGSSTGGAGNGSSAGSTGSFAAGGADASRGSGLDLSGLSTLQSKAKAKAAKSKKGETLLPDGTYEKTLPFKPGEQAEDGAALPGEQVTSIHDGASPDRVRNLAAVAAALVVFVVAGHLFLLRREVGRVPVLEHVEP